MAGDGPGVSASFKELERDGWTTKASLYDAWLGPVTLGAVDALLAAVRLRPGMRLLDVACGPGYGAGRAAARRADAVGVDFAPTMIVEARRKFPDVGFDEGDGEELAFGDSSFDAVICGFGILHMPEPEKAMREACRVLRAGGRYAFTVWAAPDRHEFLGLVLRAIAAHGRLDVALPPAPPLFRFSEAETCLTALTETGFVEVVVQELPLVWRTDSAEAIADMVHKGTVRAAMLLERQAPEAADRIHRAITEGAAQFARGGAYELAFPAVLASARKP